MNRTKIEWCDYTWNPVTGCLGPGGTPEEPKRCVYCYAHEQANGRLAKVYCSNPNVAPGCDPEDPFSPRFWPKRLDSPSRVKKPSRIFVCSMGDLFLTRKGQGKRSPSLSWCEAFIAIGRTMRSPLKGCHHTYIMLTKNPQNIPSFSDLPWEDNEWLGITVTNQADWDERWPILREVEAKVRFVSFEPLLGPVDMRGGELPDWIILGGLTGSYRLEFPFWEIPEWARQIEVQADRWNIPVFIKDNCDWMGHTERRELGHYRQEYPV